MKKREIEELLDELIKYVPPFLNGVIEKLSRGMNSILNYLHCRGEWPVCAGELASALKVSTARVAFALKTLERKGMIQRFKDKDDSRVTLVAISPKGRRYIEGRRKSALDQIQEIVKKIGEKDFREFIRISQIIKKAIEAK